MSETRIRELCSALVAAAFEELTSDRVIPMWSDAPRLQADIDFDADRIRSRSEYTALKDELLQSFPALFDDLDDFFKSFTVQQYIDTFLEEVLYQCGYADDFSPTGAPVKEVMDELERVASGHGLTVATR